MYNSDIVYNSGAALADTGSPYFAPLAIGIGLVLLGVVLLAVKLIHRSKSASN